MWCGVSNVPLWDRSDSKKRGLGANLAIFNKCRTADVKERNHKLKERTTLKIPRTAQILYHSILTPAFSP